MCRLFARLIVLTALTGCLGLMLAGCGGSLPNVSYALTGSVSIPAADRAADAPSYVMAMDYAVHVVDAKTLETVSEEVRTDFHGVYRIRSVPEHGDLLVVAERDGITVQACIGEQERIADHTCVLSPDTTVAASTAQQLRRLALSDDLIRDVYHRCLTYQTANQFKYGHCDGNVCNLTSNNDVSLTARELLRASANDVITHALETPDLEHSTQMVNVAIGDAALNSGCALVLTADQQSKLAQRTTQGDLWTPAQAAALLASAGIKETFGAAVTANDIILARQRLVTKIPAFGVGARPKICAAELVMICCQTGDSSVAFHAQTQKQLDDLVTLITTE